MGFSGAGILQYPGNRGRRQLRARATTAMGSRVCWVFAAPRGTRYWGAWRRHRRDRADLERTDHKMGKILELNSCSDPGHLDLGHIVYVVVAVKRGNDVPRILTFFPCQNGPAEDS